MENEALLRLSLFAGLFSIFALAEAIFARVDLAERMRFRRVDAGPQLTAAVAPAARAQRVRTSSSRAGASQRTAPP